MQIATFMLVCDTLKRKVIQLGECVFLIKALIKNASAQISKYP